MLHESYSDPALVTFLQLVTIPSGILLADFRQSSTPSDTESVTGSPGNIDINIIDTTMYADMLARGHT